MSKEQISNQDISYMLSDAICTYNMGGEADKKLMEKLYKYLPKDKVDEYVFDYNGYEDSGIFSYSALEFVEHFRFDKEESIER